MAPAREDWLFVDKSKYQCPGDEKPYLLEYEYARERLAYRVLHLSTSVWQQIFGDRFPHTPFLAFDPIERRNLLADVLKGDLGKLPLFDFARLGSGLFYQFEYSLTQKYQNLLEAVHEQAREDPDFTGQQRAYENAISMFKQSLPDDAYDDSIAHIQLTLQFDYSDEKLKEAFAAMLKSIRRPDPVPSKHSDFDVKLRRLAATRLYRIFGTVEKARSYAFDQGVEDIYEQDSGWTRARDEVWRTLGVDQFPHEHVK